MFQFSMPVSFGGNPSTGDPWLTVDVNPTAFHLFGLEVKWYGILIGIGLVLAMAYAFKRARSFGIDSDRMIDVVFWSVIIGIIGARAYYVLFNLQEFQNRPFWDVFKIYEGGLGIYGGIIAGMLAGYFLCKRKKVKPLPMLDLASLGFLIGQGIGRWGNFTNQEAFGTNTALPWGMYSEGTRRYLANAQDALASQGIMVDPQMPVHPCFLYESIWCLLGFVLLHLFSKKWKKYDGQIFLLYLLWYGVGRFVIEGFRTDSLMIGPLRISQVVAVLCVIASVVLLILNRNNTKIFGEEGLALQLAEEKAAAGHPADGGAPNGETYTSILGERDGAEQEAQASEPPEGEDDAEAAAAVPEEETDQEQACERLLEDSSADMAETPAGAAEKTDRAPAGGELPEEPTMDAAEEEPRGE